LHSVAQFLSLGPAIFLAAFIHRKTLVLSCCQFHPLLGDDVFRVAEFQLKSWS